MPWCSNCAKNITRPDNVEGKIQMSGTFVRTIQNEYSLSRERILDEGLFNGKRPNVSRTAFHIIAGMKQDWMQTGRKPSGLCGAALYIYALSYGFSCSKSEIGISENSKKSSVEPEPNGEDDDYLKHGEEDLETEDTQYPYYENEEGFDYEDEYNQPF